jgi:hypothetical protein
MSAKKTESSYADVLVNVLPKLDMFELEIIRAVIDDLCPRRDYKLPPPRSDAHILKEQRKLIALALRRLKAKT